MLQDRESKQEAEHAAALATSVADAIAQFARIKAGLGTVSEPSTSESAKWRKLEVTLPLQTRPLDPLATAEGKGES